MNFQLFTVKNGGRGGNHTTTTGVDLQQYDVGPWATVRG